MCYYVISEKNKYRKRYVMEKNTKVDEITREETLKLRLADLLKETTRLAGELKVNAETFEDKKLKEIFSEGGKNITEFNKKLSAHLSIL